jgi:hypothetical protein
MSWTDDKKINSVALGGSMKIGPIQANLFLYNPSDDSIIPMLTGDGQVTRVISRAMFAVNGASLSIDPMIWIVPLIGTGTLTIATMFVCIASKLGLRKRVAAWMVKYQSDPQSKQDEPASPTDIEKGELKVDTLQTRDILKTVKIDTLSPKPKNPMRGKLSIQTKQLELAPQEIESPISASDERKSFLTMHTTSPIRFRDSLGSIYSLIMPNRPSKSRERK